MKAEKTQMHKIQKTLLYYKFRLYVISTNSQETPPFFILCCFVGFIFTFSSNVRKRKSWCVWLLEANPFAHSSPLSLMVLDVFFYWDLPISLVKLRWGCNMCNFSMFRPFLNLTGWFLTHFSYVTLMSGIYQRGCQLSRRWREFACVLLLFIVCTVL